MLPEHLELQASEDACDFYLKKLLLHWCLVLGYQTSTSLGDFACSGFRDLCFSLSLSHTHTRTHGLLSLIAPLVYAQKIFCCSSVIRYDKQACQAAASVIEEFSKMERLMVMEMPISFALRREKIF